MSRPKHRSPSRTSCAISTSARWCGSRLRTLIRKSKREPSHACKACKASHACKACKASHACKAAVIPPVLLRHSLLPRGDYFQFCQDIPTFVSRILRQCFGSIPTHYTSIDVCAIIAFPGRFVVCFMTALFKFRFQPQFSSRVVLLSLWHVTL